MTDIEEPKQNSELQAKILKNQILTNQNMPFELNFVAGQLMSVLGGPALQAW